MSKLMRGLMMTLGQALVVGLIAVAMTLIANANTTAEPTDVPVETNPHAPVQSYGGNIVGADHKVQQADANAPAMACPDGTCPQNATGAAINANTNPSTDSSGNPIPVENDAVTPKTK